MIEGKLLIFSLMRTGCVHYSATMVHQLKAFDPEIYISNTSFELYPKHAKKWITYFGTISFIIHSILAIIILLPFVIYKKIQYRSLCFYFPSFHPWNLILNLYAKIFRIKTIQTVHELEYHTGENNFFLKKLKHFNMVLADQLIFLSNHEMKQAVNSSAKSNLLHHPLLIWPDLTQNKLNHSPALKLLVIGRINKYKGINILLSALDTIWQSVEFLTIAGVGNYKIPNNSNSKINRINKHLTELEIAELLTSHHVLILPYTEASQSGIIPLGVAAEIPMIISNVGGLAEQVSEQGAMFIQPNAESIRGAILELSNNQQKYSDLKNHLSLYSNQFENNWVVSFKNLFALK